MSDITTLYRFFSVDGELLYVGISKVWPERLACHRLHSDFWPRVKRYSTQDFLSRSQAAAAEKAAIRAERPLFNVAHNAGVATARPGRNAGQVARNAKCRARRLGLVV